MPRVAEIKELDGGVWARVEMNPDEGAVSLFLPSEVEALKKEERERCARHIELIAADWRESGADQKVWASEYLARQIRELDVYE